MPLVAVFVVWGTRTEQETALKVAACTGREENKLRSQRPHLPLASILDTESAPEIGVLLLLHDTIALIGLR